MSSIQTLAETIKELYSIVNKLEATYEGRRFTLDGHLVGSLGEVYASEKYGLSLYRGAYPIHDGETPGGRKVQIKATQGTRVGLTHEPDFLIVLRITKDGDFEEVYNGAGHEPWEASGELQSNGQRQISLKKLATLNANVCQKDRIASMGGKELQA